MHILHQLLHHFNCEPMRGFLMKTLAERLKWLRKKRGFPSKVKAAEAIGIKYGTYQRWEYGHNPNRGNIEILSAFYECSLAWLLRGEGEAFPDRPGVRPETRLPVIEELSQYHAGRAQATEPPDSPDIKISDDLHLAAQVLESGTPYARALHLNIYSFSCALRSETRMLRLSGDYDQLRIEMNDLKTKIEALQKENDGLKSRLNGLEAASPAAPGPDTEKKAM
jgi:transcriptional regulator with XRE-family HTH domain